jgi:cytochrome c oxidase assembly protein subunit 15
MDNGAQRHGGGFFICVASLLAATLAINLLSGYIRHHEAGLGCQPWPACYAQVGELIAPPEETNATIAALTPTETVKQAHRGIATALVILVGLVVYLARQRRLPGNTQLLPYAIVGVILLLAIVGPASYLKTLPAIATVNLAGGMALLALVWLLWLNTRPARPTPAPALKPWATAALVAIVAQILLGGWVSANFAAVACDAPLSCTALPGGGIESFWYFRELTLTDGGRVAFDGSQAVIQLAHHLGALTTALVLMVLGVLSIRAGATARLWGIGLIVLLAAQVSLGIGGLATDLMPALVLGHNLVASLLLLAVLRIVVLSRTVRPA